MCVKPLQSCPTLCDPTDCSCPWNFPRQEYWSGLPRDPLDPWIEPASLRSPALADGFFTSSTTWEALWGSHCQAKHCSVFSEEPLEGACLQRFVACFERKVTARQWCYKSSTSTAFSTAAHGKGAYKRLSSDAWSGDSSWECAIESLVLPLH